MGDLIAVVRVAAFRRLSQQVTNNYSPIYDVLPDGEAGIDNIKVLLDTVWVKSYAQ